MYGILGLSLQIPKGFLTDSEGIPNRLPIDSQLYSQSYSQPTSKPKREGKKKRPFRIPHGLAWDALLRLLSDEKSTLPIAFVDRLIHVIDIEVPRLDRKGSARFDDVQLGTVDRRTPALAQRGFVYDSFV